jgi:hypothetical protein
MDLSKLSDQELQAIIDKEETAPAISPLESGVVGVVNQGSFGLADELSGGLKTAGSVLMGDTSLSTAYQKYEQERDDTRSYIKEAELANPGSFATGEVIGAIGSSLALPVGAGIKGASTVAKAVNAAKIAGVEGALQGYGFSEKEDTELAKDALYGLAMGSLFGGAADFAGTKLVGAMQKGTGKVAGATTAVALGVRSKPEMQKLQKYLRKNGLDVESFGNMIAEDRIITTTDGSTFVRAGIKEGEPIIKIGDDLSDTLVKVETAMDSHGQELGNILTRFDDVAGGPSIDPLDVRSAIEKRLRSIYGDSDAPEALEALESGIQYIDESLKKYISIDPKTGLQTVKPMSLKQAHKLRVDIDKYGVNYRTIDGKMKGATQEVKLQVRRALEDVVEDNVSTISSSRGLAGPLEASIGIDELALYKKTKQKYGAYATLKDIAETKASDLKGNVVDKLKTMMQVKPMLTGMMVGGATGNPAVAVVGGALNWAINSQTFPQVMQQSLRRVATAIENPKYAALAGKIARGAAMSNDDLFKSLSYADSYVSLSQTPLQRSFEDLRERKDQVLNVLSEDAPELYAPTRKAFENGDDEEIAIQLDALSKTPAAKRLIQPGMGWGGKALSDVDKAVIAQQISDSRLPPSLRLQVQAQFAKDAMIPDLAKLEQAYSENRQLKDQVKVLRNNKGRKIQDY